MSSGLMIDQNCTSLPIPKLFPKVGKPQILIHKLDCTPAYSTKMLPLEVFLVSKIGTGRTRREWSLFQTDWNHLQSPSWYEDRYLLV